MAVQQLSEVHLNQLLAQIKELHYYDGTPGKLSGFISQVEQLLSLYPTQDPRQAHVIFGAIRRVIVDAALEAVIQAGATTWTEIRTALAISFKDHRPYVALVKQLEETTYPGSISKFIEKLEAQYRNIFDKLELESDPVNKSNYTEMLKRTVKTTIDRKLPDKMYMSLARRDIDTIPKLKQATMELGLYDANPEDQYFPKTQGHNRKNGGSRNQRNNQRYYNNKHSNYYSAANQSMSQTPNTNNQSSQSQYPTSYVPPHQRGNYNTFRDNLIQGRQNNPMNHQPSTSNNASNNKPIKRQRESQSGQSRMDVNFHQTASDNPESGEEESVPM